MSSSPSPSRLVYAALALVLMAADARVGAGQDGAARDAAVHDDRVLTADVERQPEEPSVEDVDGTFRLGPDDVVEVFVWQEDELSTTATVRPDGRITLPLVGELAAEGRTPQQLQGEIAARLERYIAQPVVTVIVQAINSRQISVIGEVRRPGRYRLGHQTTVLDAVAMGGGFTEYANTNRVTVLRRTPTGVERIPVHLKRLMRSGGETFYLEPKDTVQVDG